MSRSAIFLLMVTLVGLLVGFHQKNERSIYLSEKITAEECISLESEFQVYFEEEITPIILMAKENVSQASKMISVIIINELNEYSDDFKGCPFLDGKNKKAYRSISINLDSLASHLKTIPRFNEIKPETREAIFSHLVQEKYDSIINTLKALNSNSKQRDDYERE